MFDTISETLSQLVSFVILGFLISFSYEALRTIRLFFRHNILFMAIEDFLFLSFAGIITFSYSLEFGNGEFRFFYIIGDIFGAAVYFLSAGKIVSMFCRFSVKILKNILKILINFFIKIIFKPVFSFLNSYLVKVFSFANNLINKLKSRLKNYIKKMYNKSVNKNLSEKPAIIAKNRKVIQANVKIVSRN